MSEHKPDEQQLSQSIQVPLTWRMPEGMQSRFADNVIVQAKQHSFTIFFFETNIPPFLGTTEENQAFIAQAEGAVPADCVGKIVVPVEFLPEMIKALQTAYNGLQESKERKE